jgi:type IV pilus assembly protein PilA
MRRTPRHHGFTLIELMIVVAIIGILAAIAIPNYVKFQLRSKASEGRVNLAGIRAAEASYFADVGYYAAWSSTPSGSGTPPGTEKWEWPGCSFGSSAPAPTGFCAIGWQPEGDVYFNYTVETNGVLAEAGAQFFAAAESDIDGDGNINTWGIKQPDNAGGSMATGPYGCADVLNLSTGDPMLSQVGPCDNIDNGLAVF